MKAAVFSDTHSNTALMLEAVRRCRPDAIIHLGDYERDTAVLRSNISDAVCPQKNLRKSPRFLYGFLVLCIHTAHTAPGAAGQGFSR